MVTTAKAAQRAREQRVACNEWKLRVGCKRCGTRLGRLVFHHPDYGAFNLHVGESYGRTWNRIVDEIAICEVPLPHMPQSGPLCN